MDKSTSVHLDDDDQIECVHQIREDCPGGYPMLMIHAKNNSINSVLIYPTMGRLHRLHSVIGAYLAAHDEEPDGSADRADVVPAEACCGVDVDDLLHSMSLDFERREEWADPTDAEIAAGVRTAPRSGF